MRGKPSMSAREAIKKLQIVTENCKKIEEAKRSDYNILLILAVKLYIIRPDDEMFTGKMMKPEFVEFVKQRAIERMEFEAEEAAEAKVEAIESETLATGADVAKAD